MLNYSHSNPGWHIGLEAAPAADSSLPPSLLTPPSPLLFSPHPSVLLIPGTSVEVIMLQCLHCWEYSCLCHIGQAELHTHLGKSSVWQLQEKLLAIFKKHYTT